MSLYWRNAKGLNLLHVYLGRVPTPANGFDGLVPFVDGYAPFTASRQVTVTLRASVRNDESRRHLIDHLLREEQETLVSQPGSTAEQPERRIVHLEVIAGTQVGGSPPHRRTRGTGRMTRRSRRPLPTTRDGWLLLAERTLGDWASTLHGAFLMLAAVAGLIVLIGLVFGFGGVALGALLGVIVWPVAGRPSR